MEALDAPVKAVQYRRQVELPVRAWNLGDVCQEFFVRIWICKIAVDEVFGLFRLSIGSSDAIGTASWPDGQAVLPAYAADPPVAAGITPVESEPAQSQILCKLQKRREQIRIQCARQRIYPTAALCAV